MKGFLSEKEMNDLISAGFDSKKFFKDNFYDDCYYIVEKVRPLNEEEKQEMIESGDEKYLKTAKILENEKILIVNLEKPLKLSASFNYYLTLSTNDLIAFLETYFKCDYKICCNRIYHYSYSKIEYLDNNIWNCFDLNDYVICFEELLCKFIIFLLTEKRDLLKL